MGATLKLAGNLHVSTALHGRQSNHRIICCPFSTEWCVTPELSNSVCALYYHFSVQLLEQGCMPAVLPVVFRVVRPSRRMLRLHLRDAMSDKCRFLTLRGRLDPT